MPGQAPQDTTLEYPHAILSIFFSEVFFLDFWLFRHFKKAKNGQIRANFEKIKTDLDSAMKS